MAHARAAAADGLLSPTNHALMMIDHQPQMAFATASIDGVALRNNAGMVAKAAAAFSVPTVLTTIAEKTFSGPIFDEIRSALPSNPLIDRTTMNAWEDSHITESVNAIGRDRIVLAGLWTSVCIVFPALSAAAQGFEVYVISDACGDVSEEAHERAMVRMVQAGVKPVTSLQYLLELQRDWARTDTYGVTFDIARVHAGSYGLGLEYARSMFGASEGSPQNEAAA